MKTVCKSKTFHKDDDIQYAVDFFFKHLDYDTVEVPGANWIGGEPTPYDPESKLKYKTIITITKFISNDTPTEEETIRDFPGDNH